MRDPKLNHPNRSPAKNVNFDKCLLIKTDIAKEIKRETVKIAQRRMEHTL